jgi:competence protein ComEA
VRHIAEREVPDAEDLKTRRGHSHERLTNKEVEMYSRFVLVVIALAVIVPTAATAADESAEGVVNINTAGSEQLQLLPRVGPALAGRIIDFRENHGPFASIDELVAVKGIGETSLEKLSPFVTTDGATTLDAKVKLPRSSSSSPSAG